MRSLLSIAIAVLAAGCFSPDYPVGLSCDPAGWCPPGQTCNSRNICLVADRDGGVVEFDADPTIADAEPGLGALLSISIGDGLSLAIGGTHSFVITGNYENGTQLISEFAIWDSSDMAVMFVDFNGVAHGQAAGIATASCDYMGRLATAIVTVTAP